jgi:hypothetical protein
MVLSDRLRSAGTLAGLGFLTSVVATLIVVTRHTSVLIVFGCILVVFGVFKVVHSFWIKTDGKLRWSTFWTGVLSGFGGGVLFAETDAWRAVSHELTLMVFYALTAIAVSVLLSGYYDVVTKRVIWAILTNAQISTGDECLFYFAANLFSGFLIGITVGHSGARHKVGPMDGTGVAYAVGIWFLNALVLAVFGWVIAEEKADIAGKYQSAAVPIMTDATYTNAEPR